MNVIFLTTLPTLKACNSPYMQYYFKWLLVLHSPEVIFSFLIKKSRQKAIEIGTAFFFHPLGNPTGRTLDHFFYASHICHNFPYKLIPILCWWVSWNISEVINENSLSAFNYMDDFNLAPFLIDELSVASAPISFRLRKKACLWRILQSFHLYPLAWQTCNWEKVIFVLHLCDYQQFVLVQFSEPIKCFIA